VTAVALFAKAPRPGRVKTRLAVGIGDVAAVEAYRRVGRRVAEAVGAALALTVWHDPPDARDEMQAWLGEHEFLPQCSGDLGRRMHAACAHHFGRGDAPVVLIGADCPGVTAETIRAAEGLLATVDVVIGPSADGGYYLLGLNRPEPGLFAGVPWSTPRVCEITEKYCRERELSVARLPVLRDLDTIEDLTALAEDGS